MHSPVHNFYPAPSLPLPSLLMHVPSSKRKQRTSVKESLISAFWKSHLKETMLISSHKEENKGLRSHKKVDLLVYKAISTHSTNSPTSKQYHTSTLAPPSPKYSSPLLVFRFISSKKISRDTMIREGDWMCPVPACQYLNFKKRDSCQQCNCPKYATGTDLSSYTIQRVMPGDWYCGALNCGSHNYASRTSCYRCGTSKDYGGCGPGMMAPGWKTGDWICSRLGCGMHNYASRMECYKCKTPRESTM